MKILMTILLSLVFTITSFSNVIIDPPAKAIVIEKDFPLFFDLDEKVIFIDFNLLSSEVSFLFMVDKSDSVILEEDCNNKSYGTIYEINYTNFESGRYSLELLLKDGNIVTAELDIN